MAVFILIVVLLLILALLAWGLYGMLKETIDQVRDLLFRPPPPPLSAEQRLVDLLRTAASYSDRGAELYNHTPEEIAETQQSYQTELLALADEIGDARLGDALTTAIRSGAAVRDWTGDYVRLAAQVLGLGWWPYGAKYSTGGPR